MQSGTHPVAQGSCALAWAAETAAAAAAGGAAIGSQALSARSTATATKSARAINLTRIIRERLTQSCTPLH